MIKAKNTTDPAKELRAIKRAVKAYCKDCSGGSETERDKCNLKECQLWKFRK